MTRHWKGWRIRKRDGVQITLRESCQRLRDRKFRLCKAKRKLNADAIRERFARSSRRIPYISIHAYYIGRRASRKCIQRSRNLHPWRVRDTSWSIYLAEAPLRPVLCLSFFLRPELTLVTILPLFLLVALSATCILLSRWYLVYRLSSIEYALVRQFRSN